MDTDGENRTGYDPSLIDAVLAEAAHLLRHLGFAAEHTTLIGGVVPSLLVLDPPGGPHVGTTDLDLCLSLAITEGDTAAYERIEASLGKAGYDSTGETFRWKQRERLHLTLVSREVVLPDGGGRTLYTFRVTGVLGFLIAKTGALVGRDKPKDAYDIVWILENWIDGPAAAASVVATNPAYTRDEVRLALARLWQEFAATDSLGPSSYARFMAEEGTSADERLRLSRQVMGAVEEFWLALQG